MLTHLKIQNLAILENIEVSFQTGFTVLTGETGAGKSLVLDALHLLLGERASSDVIRAHADFSKIQAVFEPVPSSISGILDAELLDEGSLIIERTIYKDKGNVIKVNGSIVPLTVLKELAPYLADLHGQADTRSLLRPRFYPYLLDHLSRDVTEKKAAYQAAYHTYQAALNAVQAFEQAVEDFEKEAAFMTFQLQELDALDPSLADEEMLLTTVQEMENHDQIYHHLKSIEEGFARGALSDLNALSRSFDKLASLKDMSDLPERFQSTLLELEDIDQSIRSMVHQLDFDPKTLAASQDRLVLYDRLKRKHKTDVSGLIALRESLKEKLNFTDDQAGQEAALKKSLEAAEKDLKDAAVTLNDARQTLAKEKIDDVTGLLKRLSLDHAVFDITFSPLDFESFSEQSPNTLDFQLTPNPGEPLKSIHKAASGGELSRIMLAIKVAFLKKDQVSTLIFDEIDTGVSGKVAANVGQLLQTISEEIQVIAITHLPQVAAKAHHHIVIEKTVDAGRTRATLNVLSADERIEHLAEMLSDGTLTDDQRMSAKALLQ